MRIGKTLGTNYTMETSTTPRSILKLTEVEDLGVWTSSSLKFSLHCEKAAACATNILGMFDMVGAETTSAGKQFH